MCFNLLNLTEFTCEGAVTAKSVIYMLICKYYLTPLHCCHLEVIKQNLPPLKCWHLGVIELKLYISCTGSYHTAGGISCCY